MTAAAASAFFARLPQGRLTPPETELRDLIIRTANAAKRLLPAGGAVSLQDWVEYRMPGEVDLGTDAEGRVVLLPLLIPPLDSELDPSSSLSGIKPSPKPKAKAQARVESGSSDPFFDDLPPGEFSPKEEALRAALTSLLTHRPLISETEALKDVSVSLAAKNLLPRGVSLLAWVTRRIGEEINICDGEHGEVMRLASGKEDRRSAQEKKEAFFAALPDGSFTQEEKCLRSAILDFLAAWRLPDLANLSNMGGDRTVHRARNALLPNFVSLRDWIERRIGGELELTQDHKGQFVVHLTQLSEPDVAKRFKKLKSRGSGRDKGSGGGKAEDFLAGLPGNKLLPAEQELREAVVEFLEGWFSRHDANNAPNLAEVTKDKAVSQRISKLLPTGVPVEAWVDARIGGEVSTEHAYGKVRLSFVNGPAARPARTRRRTRGGRDGTDSRDGHDKRPEARREPDIENLDPPRGSAGASEMEGGKPEGEGAGITTAEKREVFFSQLPAEDFTEGEQAMREALLSFLEKWQGPDPPTLSEAGTNIRVRDARAALLPRNSGVSLKEWIDRRIGGEVETSADLGPQVVLGIRGTLDPQAAQRAATKKRKFDAVGGKGGGPSGGGKSRPHNRDRP